MSAFRRNKFKAVRNVNEHGTFDSKREALDYQSLLLLERGGVIKDLKRQVTFRLEVNGKLVTSYRADFTYTRIATGKTVIHETKGFWTDAFRIKWKLIKAIHGDDFEYCLNGEMEK